MKPITQNHFELKRLISFSKLRKTARITPLLALLLATLFGMGITIPATSHAAEAQAIWSAKHQLNKIPLTTCFFRKSFDFKGKPVSGRIEIGGNDQYTLYVNGRLVGSGKGLRQLDTYDLLEYLNEGKNFVAVKVDNIQGSAAGLVAKLTVKAEGDTFVTHVSDTSWKATIKNNSFWQQPRYNDQAWSKAQSFGAYRQPKATLDKAITTNSNVNSKTSPPDKVETPAERFQTVNHFTVEKVIGGKIGSLIAMEFDANGDILASKEKGPLLLIQDIDADGKPETAKVYCDKVKSCQGILPLEDKVYVIGDGPDGIGLYLLTDKNNDAAVDDVKLIMKFKTPVKEHGPHALTLGPDGYLYIVIGNHTQIVAKSEKTETKTTENHWIAKGPYRHTYEGDLIAPRYNDPGGHASKVKAPGGTILRISQDGKTVETFAGGLRNAYDLAFNADGDLFTHDADMEGDRGATWYRPTRLNHVIAGAEFGWRAGWSKWPDYYIDSLPAVANTGQGSPTGMVFYDHVMYPRTMHNGLFACDWAGGRLFLIRTKNQGASYKARTELFLTGRPLNVTDITVGADGLIYFCTGGRGTEGGVYRLRWDGKVPASVSNFGTGIARALRQPQLTSAWSRKIILQIKTKQADKWEKQLTTLIENRKANLDQRVRALQLLQYFGPQPSESLLLMASKDQSAKLRSLSVYLMGIHGKQACSDRLRAMIGDSDSVVRRKVLESLNRRGEKVSAPALASSLASRDRFEAWAARGLLQQLPQQQWKRSVLGSKYHRIFLQGSTALLVAYPSRTNALQVIDRAQQMMRGVVKDEDFLDLLRVVQLAIHRGKLKPSDIKSLESQIAEEFPSRNNLMNRELVRLIAFLGESSITDRLIVYLKSDLPEVEKVHLAMYAPAITKGWTSRQKMDLMQYYEKSQSLKGGTKLTPYLQMASRRFAALLSPQEKLAILKRGDQWPHVALSVLAKLPKNIDSATIEVIKNMDSKIGDVKNKANKSLQVGVIAILARSRQEDAMAYLREIYKTQPERRNTAAFGLAQKPKGENWKLLVQSLATIEGPIAQMILTKLAQVDQRPEKNPEAIRQVILKGLQMKKTGAAPALRLLEHWATSSPLYNTDDTAEEKLTAWQEWFRDTYPNQSEPSLPKEHESSKYSYKQLTKYLASNEAVRGSAARGVHVFAKAQCAKCHRYGDRGENVGPDLSTISNRFQSKELLQSILYPSHVISDQYRSKTILTNDGQSLSGIVVAGADGNQILITNTGKRIEILKDEIEEIKPSKVSTMPDGLLNTLTLEEIADLFAYMRRVPTTSITRKKQTSPPKK